MVRPPSFGPVPAWAGPVWVQLLMVRLVDSQLVELVTLGSELLKVTSQETLVLVRTLKVVLFVVSVAGEAAFDSVVEYNCPETLEPPAAPHAPSVKSCMDSVPFSGAPWADVMVALSFGSQVWAEVLAVVSLTVKHSPEVASLDPR